MVNQTALCLKLATHCLHHELLHAADAKGVVASLAQLLFGFNCNIVQSDQFSDESLRPSRFFQVRGKLQLLSQCCSFDSTCAALLQH